MMLVAPSCSIRIWASRLAPSPTASIEITAATPKIRPRAVRPERSLCSIKLFNPSFSPRQMRPIDERLTEDEDCAAIAAGGAGRRMHRPEAARSPIRRIRATADGDARPVPVQLYRGAGDHVNRSWMRAPAARTSPSASAMAGEGSIG